MLADLDGGDLWVVAVKATFDVRDGVCHLADKQEPVHLADVHAGEPGQSSILYEAELAFGKLGTDVTLNGHAYAPSGDPTRQVDASLTVGPVSKTVRVTGDRYWDSFVGIIEPSRPERFERMPLAYERAFGGQDLSDPKRPDAEPRNPIGRGFARTAETIQGTHLPNIEDPRDLVRSWKDRPAPAGFGVVARHWLPRRDYGGTYDAAWQRERLPLYPNDLDPRFFQSAPADLVATPHLRGGETVECVNLTPDGYLVFVLPKVYLGFRTRIGREWVHHSATLGHVIVEPDVPRVMMVWQTALPCHRQTLHLETTRITEKSLMWWN